jgi:Na+/melibiose symporter-like transporter
VTATKPKGPIPLRTIMAFSLATAPVGALSTPLLVNLPPYYAGLLGLSLSAVGLIFGAVKLLDIFIDPAIGMLMDRTRTRLGRYRVWLIASAPILMIGTWKLFFAGPGVSEVYLVLWLTLMYLGFSMLVLSQVAWGAVLTDDYDERSKVYAFGAVTGVLGGVLALLLPILMGKEGAEAIQLMGWIILLTVPITTLIVTIATPETIRPSLHADRASLKDFPRLIAHPAMRRLLLADLLFTVGPAITSPLYLFFMKQARGYTEAEAFILLILFSLAGLFGAPIWAWSAMKLGKHRSLILAAVLYAVCQAVLPLLPSKSFWLLAPGMFVAGGILSAFAFLVRAMVADVGDQVRLETGKDRIGILYSLVTSTAKIGSALAVAIALPLLAAFGFSAAPDATNTPEALMGLLLLYTVPPVTLVLLAAWAIRGYALGRAEHDEIRGALATRDAEALAAQGTAAG